MKLLIATHNSGKINVYKKIFEKHGIKALTLSDLGIKEKFDEVENTFKANAEAKAKFYFRLSQIPTIAEDGGLEIDYLYGEPGVRSRRWLGHEASDQELVDYLKLKIKEIPKDKRRARFTAVSCLVKSKDEIYSVENSIKGYLVDKYNKNYETGFPYNAFFIEKNSGQYLMDLDEINHNKIDHRRKNAEELIKYLNH